MTKRWEEDVGVLQGLMPFLSRLPFINETREDGQCSRHLSI